MNFPHYLFRANPMTSFLVIDLVLLFVLTFNYYRIGKLSRPKMILCSIVFALGVLLLLIFGR